MNHPHQPTFGIQMGLTQRALFFAFLVIAWPFRPLGQNAQAQTVVAANRIRCHDAHVEQISRRYFQLLQKRQREVYGIEVLLGQPGSAASSRFGHVALRFLMDHKDPFSDVVIDFVADNPCDEEDLLKGIQGGYAAKIRAQSLYSFLLGYAIWEQRPVERSVILTSKAQREQLVALADQFFGGASLGHYRFFSRNCSQLMAEYLNKAAVVVGQDFPSTPMQFRSWLARHLISPYPPITERTLIDLNGLVAKTLQIAETELLSPSFPWDEENVLRAVHSVTRNSGSGDELNDLVLMYSLSSFVKFFNRVNPSPLPRRSHPVVRPLPEELYDLPTVYALSPQAYRSTLEHVFSRRQLVTQSISLQRALCRFESPMSCPTDESSLPRAAVPADLGVFLEVYLRSIY